jgi:undecaprenyl-diphosphatase
MTNWRPRRLTVLASGAAFAFLLFIRITRELLEGDVTALDNSILRRAAAWRTPRLTEIAVDVTALGSGTLVVLFAAITLLVLLALRDRIGALQLLAASAGSGVLTIVTKDMIERVRPAEAQRLAVVTGFSYPSGHSLTTCALYLTIAIIAGRYVPDARARLVILLSASAVILLVAASRVYLGVHYATDALSGVSLGAAWALFLASLFERHRPRTLP